MLGMETVAERMGDHLVGHHPTMPGFGKTAQAVVTTRRLEDSLHDEKIGGPSGTSFATVNLGLRPAKAHENRRLCRMAVLGAARSRLAMEQARPSNCLIRSVRV